MARTPRTKESKPQAAEEPNTAPLKAKRARASSRPFPRKTLEEALQIPRAIKENNGGNPWPPSEVRKALGIGNTNNFFYLTATSRDFGLTEGTRDAATIGLTELGRKAVYPASPEAENEALTEAFFKIDIFAKVVKHFGGSKLPEAQFLANTLETEFGLDPAVHEEFVDLFDRNCRFLRIGAEYDRETGITSGGTATVRTIAKPKGALADGKVCFVAMPFTERQNVHANGFFNEVLTAIITPALKAAGFVVRTAQQKGSDIIQATIVTELLAADLVLADLTEHNPNVLFELGMRMAVDKPVALVRATGTGQIFDVDHMLRVEEYDPNLWPSTVENDVPRLTEHIKAAWDRRRTEQTYMKILNAKDDKTPIQP